MMSGSVAFVNARAFVDAVARVEADSISWNAFQGRVDSLDVDLRLPPFLCIVQANLEENIRQEWIVDLNEDAGIDDRLVFLVQFIGEGVEVFFLRLVVFVRADA